jgi:SSS family solute:Na+ symporter
VLYPKASTDTLLYVGRVSTVAFALLSFAWIPVFLASETGLFRTISEIQGLLTPPIGVVLVLGVTNRRVNGAGALSGLVVGTFMGALRLVVVVVMKRGTGYDTSTVFGSILHLFFGMAFLHFSILLWVTTLIVVIVVSYCTPKPQEGVEAFMVVWPEVFARNAASDYYPPWVHRWLLRSMVAILCTALVFCLIFA